MKKTLYRAALLAALGLTGVTSAQAQSSPSANDLVLGFVNSGNNDFILDLGQIPAGGGVSHMDGTAADMTAFNSVFSSFSGLYVGAVSGKTGGFNSIMISTISPASPASGSAPNSANIANAAGVVLSIPGAGAVGGGSQAIVANNLGYGQSFKELIANGSAAGLSDPNLFGNYIPLQDPLSSMSGNTVTLNLWKDTQTAGGGFTGWVAAGQLSLNLSGSTFVADFTPAPEPATTSLLAGAGMLVVLVRRKIGQKMPKTVPPQKNN